MVATEAYHILAHYRVQRLVEVSSSGTWAKQKGWKHFIASLKEKERTDNLSPTFLHSLKITFAPEHKLSNLSATKQPIPLQRRRLYMRYLFFGEFA